MAKGTGLIGNFSGKVGNTVGYNLKDSNNKQTQGIRVYQPVVKNPRTKAQAEQRARMSVINATYRALKPIIDRGQEGKAYGNKSRLAWLSQAMKNFAGPWVKKGEQVPVVAPLQVTSGSLPTFPINVRTDSDGIALNIEDMVEADTHNFASWAADGVLNVFGVQYKDQVTFVGVYDTTAVVRSFIYDEEIDQPISGVSMTDRYAGANVLIEPSFFGLEYVEACAIVISREGSNGQHLRSTQSLFINFFDPVPGFSEAEKAESIASYMQEGSNTDWPQEQL